MKKTPMKPTCLSCEYFDGGGLRQIEKAQVSRTVLYGDCLNPQSPRFETTSAKTCDFFFLSTT